MGATNTQEAGTVVQVSIPSPLHSYTGGESRVLLAIPVLAPEEPPQVLSALAALDARFPGIRFRIVDEQGRVRPHIKLFVGRALVRSLDAPVPQGAEVMIVAALSGG